MGIVHLQQAFQLIDANPDIAMPSGQKSIALLHKAEAALGVKFPPTYRRFVLRYGTLSLPPDEFYGLTSDEFVNSSVPNVVWCVLKDRRFFSLPNELIRIFSVDDGPDWAIDTSRVNEDGENPIVEYLVGITQPPFPIIAPDFGFLLLQEVRTAIELFSNDDDDTWQTIKP